MRRFFRGQLDAPTSGSSSERVTVSGASSGSGLNSVSRSVSKSVDIFEFLLRKKIEEELWIM